MSSRYAPLSLSQLLDALTVCLWRAYGRGEVCPRVGTHDALTRARRADTPPGRTPATCG